MSVLGTRCGGGFPRTPREGAVPPSIPSKGGSAPWTPERGCVAARDKPARGRAGQAGPWPGRTSRPLACGKGGGVAPRASRLLACRKGGGVAPRASRPLAYGKGGEFRSYSQAETRERAPMTHTARASASGPKRDIKFFAKLSFKKAGGVAVRRAPKKAALAGGLLFFLISGAAPDGRPQSGRE